MNEQLVKLFYYFIFFNIFLQYVIFSSIMQEYSIYLGSDIMGKIHDKTKNNFKKGSVEMLILQILLDEDCYGYDIAQRIKERSDGAITVLEGSMYPILYRLEEAGCIKQYEKLVGRRRTRVYYHLEAVGETYLQSLIADYVEIRDGIDKILRYGKA
jgi:PadR family transcriptional regulator PadR